MPLRLRDLGKSGQEDEGGGILGHPLIIGKAEHGIG